MTIKSLVTEMSIFNSGTNPIYGAEITKLRLDDESGGGFFILSQASRGEVWLELDEISAIYNRASKMIQDYDAVTDGKQ